MGRHRGRAGRPRPQGRTRSNVTATDAHGQPVNVVQTATGVVSKVSYDQGYPALNLSSGVVTPVSQLVSVGVTPTTP